MSEHPRASHFLWAGVALTLSACSSLQISQRPAPVTAGSDVTQAPVARAEPAPVPAAVTAPEPVALPPTASVKKGGYYLDDGPGDAPPADLDKLPDAVPKREPYHKYANNAYSALGRDYVPDAGYRALRQEGLASWYGKRFHGKATATGEPYDMYAMTAAHPTLPIPSYARVTSLDSGKSVVVRVNDRGPFHADRIIDLSYAAAYKLGIHASGSGRVSVEAIDPAGIGSDDAFEPRGLFVQLGAFGSRGNADSLLARARAQLSEAADKLRLYSRDGMWRVALGPFETEEIAATVIRQAGELLQIKPFKVRY